jgi:hypothetical protein
MPTKTRDVITLSSQKVQLYASNEQFVASYPDKKDYPPAEIAKLRQRFKRDALAAERHAAMQSVVFAMIVVTIDMVVFAFHWRLVTRHSITAQTSHPLTQVEPGEIAN